MHELIKSLRVSIIHTLESMNISVHEILHVDCSEGPISKASLVLHSPRSYLQIYQGDFIRFLDSDLYYVLRSVQ